MNNNLSSFDPLLFLGITGLKEKNKKSTSKNLLTRMSQYLMVRTIELLEEDDLKKVDDPQMLLALAKERIPNIALKKKEFLNDFKKEFNKNFNKLWTK